MKNEELKFDTLKKSYKKQIIVGSVFICVVGSIFTFATSKAKYKLTQDIPLVRGTVNYKVPDMRTVALYTANDNGDYVEANDVPTSGYQLNTEKSMCKVYDGTTSIENAPKDNNATIEYKNGAVTFANITKKNTRCYLYFDKKEPTASETILANVTPKSTTPTTFAAGAKTDEGVYSVSDPVYGGTSYYWRGLVTNNYVKFADKCWRIVRINGDGSIRLIYDGTTCHANGTNADSIAKTSVAYNTNYNQPYYVGWTYGTGQRPSPTTGGTASNAKTQLQSWYDSNLKSYEGKIADGIYCNDRYTQAGSSYGSSTFYYAAYKRIYTDHSPSLGCNTSDRYTLKVGLITVDEAMYAGGTEKNQTSYYLYNGQNYWTMSPSIWDGSYAYVFFVDTSGRLTNSIVDGTIGLRPVISLKADTTFKSGLNGTLNSPYEVE